MRTTRAITASLAAVLGAAALAGPAAADSQQGAGDSAKADVYVPPAAGVSVTVAPAGDTAKANVYVPPAAGVSDTVAPAGESAKANVYVPPNRQPIQRHVPAASASSWSFDWGSAGIGSAVAIGASMIALGAAAGLRRRRQIQPAATG
jgi:hypothetical protein